VSVSNPAPDGHPHPNNPYQIAEHKPIPQPPYPKAIDLDSELLFAGGRDPFGLFVHSCLPCVGLKAYPDVGDKETGFGGAIGPSTIITGTSTLTAAVAVSGVTGVTSIFQMS